MQSSYSIEKDQKNARLLVRAIETKSPCITSIYGYIYKITPSCLASSLHLKAEGLANKLFAQTPKLFGIFVIVGVFPSLAVNLIFDNEWSMLLS